MCPISKKPDCFIIFCPEVYISPQHITWHNQNANTESKRPDAKRPPLGNKRAPYQRPSHLHKNNLQHIAAYGIPEYSPTAQINCCAKFAPLFAPIFALIWAPIFAPMFFARMFSPCKFISYIIYNGPHSRQRWANDSPSCLPNIHQSFFQIVGQIFQFRKIAVYENIWGRYIAIALLTQW